MTTTLIAGLAGFIAGAAFDLWLHRLWQRRQAERDAAYRAVYPQRATPLVTPIAGDVNDDAQKARLRGGMPLI